jgi:hypothetical protein
MALFPGDVVPKVQHVAPNQLNTEIHRCGKQRCMHIVQSHQVSLQAVCPSASSAPLLQGVIPDAAVVTQPFRPLSVTQRHKARGQDIIIWRYQCRNPRAFHQALVSYVYSNKALASCKDIGKCVELSETRDA